MSEAHMLEVYEKRNKSKSDHSFSAVHAEWKKKKKFESEMRKKD